MRIEYHPSVRQDVAEAMRRYKAVSESLANDLGAWHDPPARPPPPGASEPYTYEPCDDVDPAPDYENVLTH